MIAIEEARRSIGRRVVRTNPEFKEGRITHVNGKFVFVLYQGEHTPTGNKPENLEWSNP